MIEPVAETSMDEQIALLKKIHEEQEKTNGDKDRSRISPAGDDER